MSAPTNSTMIQVTVAGAGAIGCTLAARIAMSGTPVNVFARGATLAALERDGIHLHDREGAHQVAVQARGRDDYGVQDLIFLCAKAPDLLPLAASVQGLIGPQTVIVPVVNGIPWWYFEQLPGRFGGRTVAAVDPDGALKRLLPSAQVVGAVVFITAEREAPGVVRSMNPLRIIIGEIDGETRPRTRALESLLAAAGVDVNINPSIRDPLWVKAIANISSNPLSVVSEACLAQIYGDPCLKPLTRRVLDEALLTAAACGARIPFDPDTFMGMGEEMGEVRTSMLQDYLRGAPLELAAIGDAVVELAALHGLSMPTTRHVLDLARFRSTLSRAPAQPHKENP